MKLNSKGQVTIPAELRHRHGFVEGDDVDVIDEGGVLRIVRSHALTGSQRAVQKVRGILRPGLSTDDVMGLTRGE